MIEISRTPNSQRMTVKVVKDSFDASRGRESLCMEWFGRPLSNCCTPLFYNLGCSANAVTLLRFVIAVGAVTVLGSGAHEILAWAVVGYYVVFVLDCVDGNLARVSNSASYWGKYADGLVDNIYYLLAPVATGVGLWMTQSSDTALIMGIVITLVSFVTELVRSRFSFFREWMIAETGPLSAEENAACHGPRRIEGAIAAVLVNGLFLAPLLLLFPDGMRFYLWALAGIQMPAAVLWMAAIVLQACAILRRGRLSSHARINRQDLPHTH